MQSDEQHRTRVDQHEVTISTQTTNSEHWIYLTITPRTQERRTSEEHLANPVTNTLFTKITRVISDAFQTNVHRADWEFTPHRNNGIYGLLTMPRNDNNLQALIAHLNRQGALEENDAAPHGP